MTVAADQLRSIVERIERLDEEIKALNEDKSDVYSEAKGNGYDVKALKTVIARRRKDPKEIAEHETIVDLYLTTLGTPVATRARTSRTSETPTVTGSGVASVPTTSVVRVTPEQLAEAKAAGLLHDTLTAAKPSEPFEYPDLPPGLDRRVRAPA